VRAGDKVCVLWDGRLPFILRESGRVRIPHSVHTDSPGDIDEDEGGTKIQEASSDDDIPTLVTAYKLIGGGSYVHGLADGEAVKWLREMASSREISALFDLSWKRCEDTVDLRRECALLNFPNGTRSRVPSSN
jgi:hypothetical protein